jgi:hypothetical protein
MDELEREEGDSKGQEGMDPVGLGRRAEPYQADEKVPILEDEKEQHRLGDADAAEPGLG